ncbi:MAG TPA: YggT family protein [Anaerolineales bacterium]|nr:YggT family protein [Anaerolineales bacterium]
MAEISEHKHIERHEHVREGHYGAHEHGQRVVEDINAERRIVVFKITQLIWLFFGAIEALIGLRVILKLIAANPNNAFAGLVYNFTALFLWPFQGLTVTPSAGGIVLEISSIIAMIVYAIVGWAIVKLAWVLLYHPTTRTVTVYDEEHD